MTKTIFQQDHKRFPERKKRHKYTEQETDKTRKKFPQHVTIKTLNIQNKEKILKYKERNDRLDGITADFYYFSFFY